MTKALVSISLILASIIPLQAQKKAYAVFDDLGGKSSYEKILKKAGKADIILFGERHGNPINHWLEYELTKDIFEQVNEDIILGNEAYQSDNQLIINEYLGAHLDYTTFYQDVNIGENNHSQYRQLLDFARSYQLPFIATSIPNRYIKMVSKDGFKAFNNLSKKAVNFICPIPFKYDESLPGYLAIKRIKNHGKITSEHLAQAQATKDATMAHFILKNHRKGSTFIHFNSACHSKNFEGIMWYLKQENPDLKILTIHCVEQKELKKLAPENESTAHFILVTPESMKQAQ
tara:strand:- start:8628 stop:9494 length:867 start_codon:yes stop_codon:yes gene_type:complete